MTSGNLFRPKYGKPMRPDKCRLEFVNSLGKCIGSHLSC